MKLYIQVCVEIYAVTLAINNIVLSYREEIKNKLSVLCKKNNVIVLFVLDVNRNIYLLSKGSIWNWNRWIFIYKEISELLFIINIAKVHRNGTFNIVERI